MRIEHVSGELII